MDVTTKHEPANPAELQLYARATMSERAADAILPPARAQVLQGSDKLEAAATWHEANEQRRQAANTDASHVKKELAKWDAKERAEAIADRASILIHVPKAPTNKSNALEAEYDAIHNAVETRLERMAKARCWSIDMAAWLDDQDWLKGAADEAYQRADKLRMCGSYLVFHELVDLDENRLARANFCRQPKLCPLCAMRRAAKEVQAHAPIVIQQVREMNLTPYMLTMTVKGGPDLAERLEHLTASWRKLIKNRRRVRTASSRNKGGELSTVDGGRYSIEIKRGKNSGLWHPHLHAVILCHLKPDAEKLAQEWHNVTGDSFIIDVRPMHNHAEAVAHDDPRIAAELIAADLVEVLKYPMKFGSMTHRDTWHAHGVASGKRLTSSFGCLRGVEVDTSYLDDPITSKDWPYVEIVARWIMGGYEIERADDWDHDDDAHDYFRNQLLNRKTGGSFSGAKAPSQKTSGDNIEAIENALASPHMQGATA